MLNLNPDKIYISSANVDMRKIIDRLSAIVQQKFDLTPFENAMFVFHNRHCNKIKILYWDNNGFCLLYKRLEQGKFMFPRQINSEKYTVTKQELSWLLNGLYVEEIRKYETLKNENKSSRSLPIS